MNTVNSKKKKNSGLEGFLKHFKKDWQLYLIILIPFIYALIFYYGPMYGVQIAFRSYSPKLGITGSKWVGLKWFHKFLTNYEFKEVFFNTIILGFTNMANLYNF